jgi:hypothetical protein
MDTHRDSPQQPAGSVDSEEFAFHNNDMYGDHHNDLYDTVGADTDVVEFVDEEHHEDIVYEVEEEEDEITPPHDEF